MSVVVGIWVVIILVRWVIPALWSFFSRGAPAPWNWQRRGKVLGHRGPGPRSFKGRAGRREWWLSMLGNTLAGAIVGAVPTIGPLLSLPWVIGTLAVNARRLHDLSLSAWLQLAPMAFGGAFAAWFIHLGGSDQAPAYEWRLDTPIGLFTMFAALTGLVYAAFYVLVGFAPGRSGPNVYGEADPT